MARTSSNRVGYSGFDKVNDDLLHQLLRNQNQRTGRLCWIDDKRQRNKTCDGSSHQARGQEVM